MALNYKKSAAASASASNFEDLDIDVPALRSGSASSRLSLASPQCPQSSPACSSSSRCQGDDALLHSPWGRAMQPSGGRNYGITVSMLLGLQDRDRLLDAVYDNIQMGSGLALVVGLRRRPPQSLSRSGSTSRAQDTSSAVHRKARHPSSFTHTRPWTVSDLCKCMSRRLTGLEDGTYHEDSLAQSLSPASSSSVTRSKHSKHRHIRRTRSLGHTRIMKRSHDVIARGDSGAYMRRHW